MGYGSLKLRVREWSKYLTVSEEVQSQSRTGIRPHITRGLLHTGHWLTMTLAVPPKQCFVEGGVRNNCWPKKAKPYCKQHSLSGRTGPGVFTYPLLFNNWSINSGVGSPSANETVPRRASRPVGHDLDPAYHIFTSWVITVAKLQFSSNKMILWWVTST